MASAQSLRSLARAYAAGTLEKESYRKQRADYLEAVLSEEITVKTRQPSGNRTATDRTGETRQKPDRTDPAATTQNSQFNSKAILIGGGIILLVIIIAVVLIPDGNDAEAPEQSATSPSAPSAPAVTGQSDSAAQELIKTFLANNVWSESSMETFLNDWNAIPAVEKTDIRNAAEFSQLSSSIYKKLVEERALSTIGNPETSLNKQRQLVEFARAIGITDSRISLPRQPNASTP